MGLHHKVADRLGIRVGFVLAAAAVLAVIVGLISWGFQYEYGSEQTVTFKIEQVTSVATQNSNGGTGHQYQVYTAEGNVLANSDSILHGKTDSSNVQAWLTAHQGQVVSCPVYGYRVFIVSSYKDILDGCKVAPKGATVDY